MLCRKSSCTLTTPVCMYVQCRSLRTVRQLYGGSVQSCTIKCLLCLNRTSTVHALICAVHTHSHQVRTSRANARLVCLPWTRRTPALRRARCKAPCLCRQMDSAGCLCAHKFKREHFRRGAKQAFVNTFAVRKRSARNRYSFLANTYMLGMKKSIATSARPH